MLIREMTIEDYEEAFDLWVNTKGMGITKSDSKIEIEKYLERNPGFSFVSIDEGKIVGTILCLENLKVNGIMKCHLMAYADNEIGNRFWSHVGWSRRSDIELYSKNL